jgi:hypothetical protein
MAALRYRSFEASGFENALKRPGWFEQAEIAPQA